MNKQIVRLLLIFILVLIGSGVLVYVLLERSRTQVNNAVAERSADAPVTSTATPGSSPVRGNDSILNELFGTDTAKTATEVDRVVAAQVLLRFVIAAFLAVLLAFRWRRNFSAQKRNPYVAQTQILLAVVAAAMMMIVGDSAARAFGIFAAASLVRFRTNIRDPKETTVLLICLGVGLACGVGRFELALILTFFALFALWILEYFESRQIFRAMEFRVETRNLDQTQQVLKNLFERHGCTYELRHLERPAEDGANGKVVYALSLASGVRTDQLSDEILSEDSGNIAAMEWDQKKSLTYLYN